MLKKLLYKYVSTYSLYVVVDIWLIFGNHTSLSPRLGGRLNLGGAVWAVKLICTLLIEKSCLAFFKICLKIHFYTSNMQISFTAQTAPPKFSLPPRRGLKLVWWWYIFINDILLDSPRELTFLVGNLLNGTT